MHKISIIARCKRINKFSQLTTANFLYRIHSVQYMVKKYPYIVRHAP